MFDQRFLKITVAVLLFHAGLLYLIQSGLGRKMTEAIIAPEIIAHIIPMEPPKAPPTPEPPKAKPETPPKQVKVVTPRPTPQPPKPAIEPAPSLPPSPTAIEAPPAPPAPPAPEPAPAPPPVSAAPRAIGIGEVQCSQPAPTYPRQSIRLNETGTTMIRLTIDEGGRISKSSITQSSGSSRLDEAALDAVRRMRCQPYMDNGRPISVTAVQPINFELK